MPTSTQSIFLATKKKKKKKKKNTNDDVAHSIVSRSEMLQAGIEALFGRNRDHHRKRNLFRRTRRHQPPHHHQKSEQEELATLFLDQPQTKKELLHGSHFAFAAMQGWRSTMEDKQKHLIPFDSSAWKLWSFFAIFDGHNGEIDLSSAPRIRGDCLQGWTRRGMLLIISIFICCKP